MSLQHLRLFLLLAVTCLWTSLALAQAGPDRDDPLATWLVREIAAARAGHPHLEDMEPAVQELVRQQLAAVQKTLLHLGTLESITFKRSHKHLRIYELWFANGRTFWAVGRGKEGKINALWFTVHA